MPILTFCIISFLLEIIISAVANDFTAMLIGRTTQGIGGVGIILMNDIIITDLVPLRRRGAYFGIIAGVWAVGSISGPVIGGVLAYKANWVSSFSKSLCAWRLACRAS
jgi:MFS family permease